MLCLVCDQKGAARHYGSISCSGCKGFFRRSVRYNRKYVCTFDNNCKISNEYRNCCRACRFRKCISIGLDPKMVHSDRSCDTMLKRRAANECNNNGNAENDGNDSSSSGSPPVVSLVRDLKPAPACADDNKRTMDLMHATNLIRLSQHCALKPDNLPLGLKQALTPFDPSDCVSVQRYYVLVDRLLDDFHEHEVNHLIGVAPYHNVNLDVGLELALLREPRAVSDRSSLNWTASFPLPSSCFARVWARLLVHFVDWGSHVAELQLLAAADRCRLLVGRMTSCWWLAIVDRSLRHARDGRRLLLTTGGSYLALDEEENLAEECFPTNLINSCRWLWDEVAQPAQELQVQDWEFALLRLIVLFTPPPTLSHHAKCVVRDAQKFYRTVLSELVCRSQSDPLIAAQRICGLMGLCTPLEHMAQFETDSLTMLIRSGSSGRLPCEYYAQRTQALI